MTGRALVFRAMACWSLQLWSFTESLYQAHALQPSIFRKKKYRRVEKSILRELIAIQPEQFREDKTAFEQLVRMQHYCNEFRIEMVPTKVPATAKRELRGELDGININASTLFQEIEPAAKYIISKVPPVDGEGDKSDSSKRFMIEILPSHLPVKRGRRFSMNAVRPSR